MWQTRSCVLYQTRLGLYKQAVPLARSAGDAEEVGPIITTRQFYNADSSEGYKYIKFYLCIYIYITIFTALTYVGV